MLTSLTKWIYFFSWKVNIFLKDINHFFRFLYKETKYLHYKILSLKFCLLLCGLKNYKSLTSYLIMINTHISILNLHRLTCISYLIWFDFFPDVHVDVFGRCRFIHWSLAYWKAGKHDREEDQWHTEAFSTDVSHSCADLSTMVIGHLYVHIGKQVLWIGRKRTMTTLQNSIRTTFCSFLQNMAEYFVFDIAESLLRKLASSVYEDYS